MSELRSRLAMYVSHTWGGRRFQKAPDLCTSLHQVRSREPRGVLSWESVTAAMDPPGPHECSELIADE